MLSVLRNLWASLIGEQTPPKDLPALKYGKEMEAIAKAFYLEIFKKNHKDVKYRERGLFIHETKQKKLGLYGIRTLDLWDTGAALLPIELTSQLGAGH